MANIFIWDSDKKVKIKQDVIICYRIDNNFDKFFVYAMDNLGNSYKISESAKKDNAIIYVDDLTKI